MFTVTRESKILVHESIDLTIQSETLYRYGNTHRVTTEDDQVRKFSKLVHDLRVASGQSNYRFHIVMKVDGVDLDLKAQLDEQKRLVRQEALRVSALERKVRSETRHLIEKANRYQARLEAVAIRDLEAKTWRSKIETTINEDNISIRIPKMVTRSLETRQISQLVTAFGRQTDEFKEAVNIDDKINELHAQIKKVGEDIRSRNVVDQHDADDVIIDCPITLNYDLNISKNRSYYVATIEMLEAKNDDLMQINRDLVAQKTALESKMLSNDDTQRKHIHDLECQLIKATKKIVTLSLKIEELTREMKKMGGGHQK
jgi:hypothetical protein